MCLFQDSLDGKNKYVKNRIKLVKGQWEDKSFSTQVNKSGYFADGH